MKENKFLKLIRTLDTKEVKSFHKYLVGLYGKQEKMVSLFNYFYKDLKQGKRSRLPTEAYLQNKLYKEKQSPKVIANLFADLYKYLEEFLRWQKINSAADNYEKDKLQIEIYKERKLDSWFYDKIEKTKNKIHKSPIDAWSFLKLLELNHTNYFKFSTEKHNQDSYLLLTNGLSNLDNFFLALKLGYACELKKLKDLHQSVLVEDWLLEHVLENESDKISQNKYLSTYRLILKLMTDNKDEDYIQLKDSFLNERNLYQPYDQLIILGNLMNFIAQKMRTANSKKTIEEAFELSKIGLEEKISMPDGEIGAVPFFNILNIACRLEEIEWAEYFLKEYSELLTKKDKIEAVKIANAIISFEKQAFQDVLTHLRDISFNNIFYATRARALILKSLIETDVDKSRIQYECEAFSQFLRRNKLLSTNLLSGYKNFLKVIKMLYVNKQTTKSQLSSTLDDSYFFVYRTWLEDKVDKFRGLS